MRGKHLRLPVLFYLLFGGAFVFSLPAQEPTIQDCLGAVPICRQVYEENNSPRGRGNYPNEVNSALSCSGQEDNSIWYTFTVNRSGNFGFLLTPKAATDDYDWALFNITNANCGDIYTDRSLLVSCNAAGDVRCQGPTGATGASSYNIQGAGCDNSPPSRELGLTPFNRLIPVEEKSTYVLMVNNWTGSDNGYTIDFGISDANVLDLEGPELRSNLMPENCTDQKIELVFNENIQCFSIANRNFQLTGPSGDLYALNFSSSNCINGGAYAKEFILAIDRPLVESGTYTFEMTADGSTDMLDNCGNPFAPGVMTFTFDIDSPGMPLVNLGNDTSLCSNQPLLLDASNNQASYEWQDGSGAPTYAVGRSGLYSVTVMNACGEASDEIDVGLLVAPPFVELGNDTLLCADAPLRLDVGSERATYQWQDGGNTAALEVSSPGTYSVTVTNACGSNSDEIKVDFVNSAPQFDLGGDILGCRGETVFWDVTSERAEYRWQDGSTSATYEAVEEGLYSVTVSNVCGTLSREIQFSLLDGPPVVDLGPDQVRCEGEVLQLDARSDLASYAWSTGAQEASINVSASGTYRVIVSNACGEDADEIAVDFAPKINIDLGEERFLCEQEAVLNAEAHEFATYRWQDGFTGPVYRTGEPGLYTVEISSSCETVVDSVFLRACQSCDVFVPNAFSPNGDGQNDYFQPYSSCDLLDFTFRIFDRWGALLYESNDPLSDWDGKFNGQTLSNGVYIWMMQYTVSENGESRTEMEKGDIVILH